MNKEEMNKRIKDLAKNISDSVSDYLLGIIIQKAIEIESLSNRELSRACRANLFFESVYFSVNYIIENTPTNFSFDEKKLFCDELHNNLLHWLIDTGFSAKNNPAGYEDKIKHIYYDTLNARNLAYADSQGSSKVVFREILSKEFIDAGLTIDKSLFDSISSDIIERLNMQINLLSD